jgi:mRNA interferase MazF
MGKFVKGDIIVIPFPFSDLSASKRRPALVVATLLGDDLILCQITSQSSTDPYAIAISDIDFKSGGLHKDSNVRPNRIFTADSKIVLYRAGVLAPNKVKEVIDKIIEIIST